LRGFVKPMNPHPRPQRCQQLLEMARVKFNVPLVPIDYKREMRKRIM
jgi:hypothetical protein